MMRKNLFRPFAAASIGVTSLFMSVAAISAECTTGDHQHANGLAMSVVSPDPSTHIFVAVPLSEDCDDWQVYKRTPGIKYSTTAAIVTIEDWQVVDVLYCPTGC